MFIVVDFVNKFVFLSSDNEIGMGKVSMSIYRLMLVLF